jgi:diguanylate cyclase (GGDEF)-like protein
MSMEQAGMSLDLKTIMFVTMVSSFGLSLLIGAFSYSSRRFFVGAVQVAGIWQWAAAFMSLALGIAFFLLRTQLGEFVSVVVGNALVLAGALLIYDGLAVFLGFKPVRSWYAPLLISQALGLGYFTSVDPNGIARFVLTNALLLIVQFAGIKVLWDARKAGVFGFGEKLLFGLIAGLFLASSGAGVEIWLSAQQRFEFDLLKPGEHRLLLSLLQALSVTIMPVCLILAVENRLIRKLEHVASHDSLTGIWVRSIMINAIERQLAALRRYGTSFGLLIIDLDYFKPINDQHGHLAGDAVLIEVVSAIAPVLRAESLFGRLGGEEFAVLLPNCNASDLHKMAERIRAVVENLSIRYEDLDLKVTVSIGGCQVSDPAVDKVATPLTVADRALYRAKDSGRNRVEIETLDAVASQRPQNPASSS